LRDDLVIFDEAATTGPSSGFEVLAPGRQDLANNHNNPDYQERLLCALVAERLPLLKFQDFRRTPKTRLCKVDREK
jgi:hypothetical protein